MKTVKRFLTQTHRFGSRLGFCSCALLALLSLEGATLAREPLAPLLQSEPSAPNAPGGRFGEYEFTLPDLREPTRTAITGESDIFVVEKWAHRVAVFSSGRNPFVENGAGKLLISLGKLGSGPGELRDPSGVALLSTPTGNHLFVADTGNHRISVFDPYRQEHLAHYGSFGSELGQLNRPTDVVVVPTHTDASDGETARIVVSDTGNHRVAVFDEEGNALATFGKLGNGRGELREPAGMAVDGEGRILVADAGNHRIVRFTPAGEVDLMFGARGPNPGLFSSPVDVDWSGGRIYVADCGNHRIQVFDDAGQLLYEWGIHVIRPREGEGHLHYPSGISIDPGGRFSVVCEAASDRVQVFGLADGPASKYMTDPELFSQGPARHFGMNIDASGPVLAIAEPETESVLIYAIEGTTPLMVTKLGGLGPLADDFVRVDDVDLSADGREIIASDSGARRLTRFRLDRAAESELRYDLQLGRFVEGASLDRLPLGEYAGLEPGAVVRDAAGRFFMVDLGQSRILRFSSRFKLERVFGSEGSEPGQLRSPTDLALSADGRELWVVDAGNARLSVFDAGGTFLRNVGERAGMDRPHGIALLTDGIAFVTDAGLHRVHIFDSAGKLSGGFGQKGLGAVEFYKPRGIAIDGEGRVIVLDHGNHRGQIFSASGEFLSAFGARLYVLETRRKRDS